MDKFYHEALISKVFFRNRVISWFKRNQRDLPWRIKKDKSNYPYRVLVSEFMLQQTVVKTVIPYFNRFIIKWPNIEALSKAKENEILIYWQGLGYYSRAKNLLKTAKIIQKQYNGKVPNSEEKLIQLPGIGSYASAAVRAIAYNKPSVVVDGNIKRVIARYCGLKGTLDININLIINAASKLASQKDNELYSQGLMELGAVICKPKNPLCNECKVKKNCQSFINKLQNQIPEPKKRTIKKKLYCSSFLVLMDNRFILLKKRSEKILQNQWELPSTKWLRSEPISVNQLTPIKDLDWKKSNILDRHLFSHIDLKTRIYFSEVNSKKNIISNNGLKWVDINNLSKYPSTLMCKKALRKYKLI